MVAKELTDRGIRMLVMFGLVWAACFGYKNVGCVKFDGPEMSPTIESGQFKFSRPVNSAADVNTDDILCYEMYFMTEMTQSTYGGKAKVLPGQVADKLPTAPSTQAGYGEDTVNLPCPRDCFIVIGDALEGAKDFDSRRLGVIPLGAVKGKKW